MSTMLETFDTQMLDFQADSDYSMQVSTSDTWFQGETIMEDDGLDPPQTTIEVDMEPFDEQQAEYEMEDDLGTAQTEQDEILDVEVYDASRFQSPDALQGEEVPFVPVDSIEPAAVTDYTEASDFTPSSPVRHPSDGFTPEVQYNHLPSPRLPFSNEKSSLPLDELQHPIRLEASHDVVDPHADTEALVASNSHDSSVVVTEEPLFGVEVDVAEYHEEADGVIADILEASALETHASTVPSDAPGDETEHGNPSETHIVTVSRDALEGEQPVQEHEQTLELEGSTNDPHEISEGVYIDPPPPVLISLTTEAILISLFNAPPRSRLNSPSHKELDDVDLVVLLGQLPTLYYEPLSSVFEALRQEEFLSRVPDLLNGELLLDAFDLELTMSEDYTYAHEISLHDLNVLHDGLNKSGPLRLRLKSVSSRFIDRYHLLQDQIAHFQVTELETEDPLGASSHGDNHTGTDADASDLLQNQENDHKPELETAATLEGENWEQQHLSEGSTTPIVETDSIIDHREPATKDEEEILDHPGTDEFSEHNEDGYDSHTGDQLQEDTETGNPSSDAVDKQLPEAGEELAVTQTSSGAPLDNRPEDSEQDGVLVHAHDEADGGGFEDFEHQNLVEAQSLEHFEETGSSTANDPDEPLAEHDLTTNVKEELDPANVTLVNELRDPDAADDALYPPDADWDDTLDGDGDWDTEEHEHVYEQEHGHEHDTASDLSSITLSSKSSAKRSLAEAELEEFEDEDLFPSSPDPKRPRVE